LRARTVTLRPLIKRFFRSPGQEEWLQGFARECGLDPVSIDDPHAWVSGDFYYGLFDKVAELSENPKEDVYRAALAGFSRENLGSLHVLARALGKPSSAYARYAVYLNSLQDIGKYEMHVLQDGAATISFTPNGDLPHKELDCLYRRGVMEAIPTLWRLPAASSSHECCVSRGDPRCIYELKWVPMRRRRITWAAGGVGLALGAGLWGGMALSGAIPPSALLAVALVAPWPVLGFLAGRGWLLAAQLRDTSQLMTEQMKALERELRTIWEKCEETERRAADESKVRKMFQKYVPSPVVEQVLSEDAKVLSGGRSAEVTVLFADLVGFTAYAETKEPDDVLNTVNLYLGSFSEAIGTYGGVVDKYIGDNVMAVFGAPVLDPYGPSKAVNCAQHLLKIVKELNAQTGLEFDLRVGVHHGAAVAGHVGSADRVNYTVMGDTVNLAQRLQNEAEPGKILISQEVRDRCDSGRDFQERGAIIVRGRRSKTSVYELT
jgi:class 3 adenylate cyclase